MQQRMEALKRRLSGQGIQVGIVTSPDNVFYFTGFMSDPHERVLAAVFFEDSDPFLICPLMEAPDAVRSGFPHSVIGYGDAEDPWKKLKEEVEKRAGTVKRIGIEKSHLNVERFEILRSAFPSSGFVPLEETINELRLIKDERELERLRKAGEWADRAIEIAIRHLKEGVTELEVAAAIEYELKRNGIEQMSFPTTVLFGANAASPHGNPGTNKLKKGDLVLFDLGVVYEGYCSDITRTVAFGEVTEEQRTVYETVRKAQEAAVALCKPGITCAELDREARNVIEKAGFGPYFTHRLGHGLGIGIHEYPSVSETNGMPLQKGMVFTVEPGIYIPGKIGVRIEDDVCVTEDGCEVLTRFPKTLQIIG
ncbi:MAG: peptidase M24 family protein [Caldibacillus debilis]|uniref:M24 family metallopeptidase n=1 Tax=Caldibacillus debilis TaxID=301148 RepID=UPI000B55AE46|nr:Xaa-Pro peptidase family protein [Caldibacillus debilis]OUM91071.1 MAG: metallopeptidase [Caldibacillus debilis]REJ17507.1 MAG: peptidase M24 family protein [Caldibacillus debilis]